MLENQAQMVVGSRSEGRSELLSGPHRPAGSDPFTTSHIDQSDITKINRS